MPRHQFRQLRCCTYRPGRGSRWLHYTLPDRACRASVRPRTELQGILSAFYGSRTVSLRAFSRDLPSLGLDFHVASECHIHAERCSEDCGNLRVDQRHLARKLGRSFRCCVLRRRRRVEHGPGPRSARDAHGQRAGCVLNGGPGRRWRCWWGRRHFDGHGENEALM